MHTYVVNLARSVDRREHITAELKKTGIDYEIITAVDGRGLDLNASPLIDPALPSNCPFPVGAAGCALSHFHIYQKILEGGQEHALILEDDVSLPADLGNLVDDLADHLTGAEVALLNFSSYPPDPLKISSEGTVGLSSARQLGLPVDSRQLVNAGAYVITGEACRRMVEGLLPIRTTADDWGSFYADGMLDARSVCTTTTGYEIPQV